MWKWLWSWVMGGGWKKSEVRDKKVQAALRSLLAEIEILKAAPVQGQEGERTTVDKGPIILENTCIIVNWMLLEIEMVKVLLIQP